MPIGMKRKFVFCVVPYYKYHKIVYLLDPMHIFKMVSSYLWRHISLQNETLGVKRLFISSNTKKKNWQRKESRGEANPSWSFKEGDVPWILMKDYVLVEKDIILVVKEPSLYGSTL